MRDPWFAFPQIRAYPRRLLRDEEATVPATCSMDRAVRGFTVNDGSALLHADLRRDWSGLLVTLIPKLTVQASAAAR